MNSLHKNSYRMDTRKMSGYDALLFKNSLTNLNEKSDLQVNYAINIYGDGIQDSGAVKIEDIDYINISTNYRNFITLVVKDGYQYTEKHSSKISENKFMTCSDR